MDNIKRLEVDEFWADSTVIEAGDYVFIGYCMGNEGQAIEAQIDGAGEWQIFTKIAFPLSKTCLYSVAILVFIDYWNMVEQPLILLSDTEIHPLSVFLSQINSNETGLAFALATIYMIPCLLLFLHGEEYLVEGIANSGSVKG